MAVVDKNTLLGLSNQIKLETTAGANTNTRVGTLLINIIDSLIHITQLVQSSGQGTESVMSQKAVTDAITALSTAIKGGVDADYDTLKKVMDYVSQIGDEVGNIEVIQEIDQEDAKPVSATAVMNYAYSKTQVDEFTYSAQAHPTNPNTIQVLINGVVKFEINLSNA